MKRIVIADHHPVTRKGIACMLKKNDNFTIVGKANNGDELFKNLQEYAPDILIMEIDMPQINGINALRTIKIEFPETRVLIFLPILKKFMPLDLSSQEQQDTFLKTASTKIFLKALKQISKGGIFLNDDLTSTFTSRNVGEASAISRYKKPSSREIEVLNLLSSGKRNKDIANALNINEKTVSTYKTRLLKVKGG